MTALELLPPRRGKAANDRQFVEPGPCRTLSGAVAALCAGLPGALSGGGASQDNGMLFLISGAVDVSYDLALCHMFQRVPEQEPPS